MRPPGHSASQGQAQKTTLMSAPADPDQNQHSDDRRGPRIFVPPPLITLTMLGAGWGVEQYWAVNITDASWIHTVGIGLLVVSLSLAIAAALPFFFHKTSIEPWQPTSTIIQSGVYGFSRNPIYLAFCLASSGIGFYLNSLWVLASVFPLVLVLQFAVIRREEIYLEKKFGEHYLEYKNRVRRWL